MNKVLKDKAFANRLAIACDNHPQAPAGHGRHVWVKRYLEEMTGVNVTVEAIRKWFSGESRPRPKIMTQLAFALKVDEGWLSLGLTPVVTSDKIKKAKFNAMASGAVNLVAGQIQLAGGSIAYPEDDDHDLVTITRGKQLILNVCFGAAGDVSEFNLPVSVKNIIVVYPTYTPTVFRFIKIPSEIVAQHGVNLGGFMSVKIRCDKEKTYWLGDERLPEITDFAQLDA
jgi:hypothetical protein